MMFQRKDETTKPGDTHHRRVVSDMRPRGTKPLHSFIRRAPSEGISAPASVPTTLPRRTEKKNQYPPVIESEFAEMSLSPSALQRPRALWYGVGIFVLLAAILGTYVAFASNLKLVVERKKTVFDLGSPGIKVTIPAKLFSDSLAKRGEEFTKNTKTFSDKSHGTITVYNAYNASSQVLVAGTRFATPDGLIFRSTLRVVVPGRTVERPGAIDVSVIADQPGPKYNIGLMDFTIPAFGGSPKFEKFYGRSKTEMKGGALGEGKVVGTDEANTLLVKLENDMKRELAQKFESAIPKDYVVFPSQFDYKTSARVTDPPVGSPADKFFAEVRGEARTLALDPKVYSDSLAALLFKSTYQQNATVLHPSSTITFKNIAFNYNAQTVTVLLEGKAIFQWVLRVDELKQKVLEAPDADSLSDSFFKAFPAIMRVEAVFTPRFWKRIPQDEKKLTIELQE